MVMPWVVGNGKVIPIEVVRMGKQRGHLVQVRRCAARGQACPLVGRRPTREVTVHLHHPLPALRAQVQRIVDLIEHKERALRQG